MTRHVSSLFLQRSASGPETAPWRGSSQGAAWVPRVLDAPGRPLEPALREDMESRLGHDFSRVRVHTDVRASESARSVQARAYTAGEHLVFGAGQYAPHSPAGRRLLAHELTHVVQQHATTPRSGPAPVHRAPLELGAPDSPAEHEAEAMAEKCGTGVQTGRSISTAAPLSVQRQGPATPAPAAPVSCPCSAATEVFYDTETYRYIGTIATLINTHAAAQGVSPVAVAGSIADEYNTRRGAKGMIDEVQDAVVGSLEEGDIDVDRFFDFHSKLLNALENDVGMANIKVRTALELVQRGELTVPGSPRSAIRVSRIIEFLRTHNGTVATTAALIARARRLFGPYLGRHGPELRDAIYAEYFKQGEPYYKRFTEALAADPTHTPCPGEGGCRVLYNYQRLSVVLRPSPAPAPGVRPPSGPPPPTPPRS